MVPPLERFERREEPEAQGGEFVEVYVASARSKSATKRSLSEKGSVSGKAPTPKGFKCGPARCAGATSAGAAFKNLLCALVGTNDFWGGLERSEVLGGVRRAVLRWLWLRHYRRRLV